MNLYIDMTEEMASHLETPGLDNPEICGHPVSKLDVNDVSESELGRLHRDLLSVPPNHRVLRYQILEALHDLRGLCLLMFKKRRMVKMRGVMKTW